MEKRIKAIEDDLDTLNRVVFQGNGRPSLVTMIAKSNVKLDALYANFVKLNDNVDLLLTFQTELQTERKIRKEEEEKNLEKEKQHGISYRWKIALIVSIALSLGALCIKFL